MRAVPLTLKEANVAIAKWHRHHKPVVGHRFSIGAEKNGELVGVAVVGRPVARKTDQYRTAEVTRLATDGTKNACSFLYGACRRTTSAMGFDRIQTFILASEPGTSLKASGWRRDGETPGRSWSVPSRARQDKHPIEKKVRWVCDFPAPTDTEKKAREEAESETARLRKELEEARKAQADRIERGE